MPSFDDELLQATNILPMIGPKVLRILRIEIVNMHVQDFATRIFKALASMAIGIKNPGIRIHIKHRFRGVIHEQSRQLRRSRITTTFVQT